MTDEMRILITLLMAIVLTGCMSNSKFDITGKWYMYKVIQEGNDVTSEHDPYDDRFIILNEDSTFVSGGRPYGKNTGLYKFNARDRILYLDSDSGPEDDSQWKVRIESDTMYWRGFGFDWSEQFELIHIRNSE